MSENKPSPTRTRVAALLLAIVTGIVLSSLINTPAQAAFGNCVGARSGSSFPGAWVCFDPDGELLHICDTAADGHHASAAVRGSADDHWFEVGAYLGNNRCWLEDFDMPEDSHICYAAMVVEGDAIQWEYRPYSGWVSADDGAVTNGCPGFDWDDVVME